MRHSGIARVGIGMTEPLIELNVVRYGRPGRPPVLSGVDFRLERGARVGLIGANGAGKTTFLHLLVGLLKPTAGEIRILGKVRKDEDDFQEVRQRVGLVFQDADDQLFCPTVIEDVAFGPLNLGLSPVESREIARDTLRNVGLEGFEERITYRLSGGEKRLVALATVLAMNPAVLLLDEPTNGLDQESRRRILDVLQRQSQAMIVVSHEHGFVDELSHRLVTLSSGTLREEPATSSSD